MLRLIKIHPVLGCLRKSNKSFQFPISSQKPFFPDNLTRNWKLANSNLSQISFFRYFTEIYLNSSEITRLPKLSFKRSSYRHKAKGQTTLEWQKQKQLLYNGVNLGMSKKSILYSWFPFRLSQFLFKVSFVVSGQMLVQYFVDATVGFGPGQAKINNHSTIWFAGHSILLKRLEIQILSFTRECCSRICFLEMSFAMAAWQHKKISSRIFQEVQGFIHQMMD